jgi:hypothetical protein
MDCRSWLIFFIDSFISASRRDHQKCRTADQRAVLPTKIPLVHIREAQTSPNPSAQDNLVLVFIVRYLLSAAIFHVEEAAYENADV